MYYTLNNPISNN